MILHVALEFELTVEQCGGVAARNATLQDLGRLPPWRNGVGVGADDDAGSKGCNAGVLSTAGGCRRCVDNRVITRRSRLA